MINIWVCDDNKRMAVLTAKFIEREFLKRKEELLLDIFYNGKEVLDILLKDNKAPDILFIAVRMKGIGGVMISEYFMKKYCATLIIFISAFEDALEMAVKSKPFACILKRDLNSEIAYFIAKARIMLKQNRSGGITAVSRGRRIYIPYDKIKYVMCLNKELIINTVDGQAFGVRDTLKRISVELTGKGFYIINRGVMVNFSCIRKLSGYDIILDCGTKLSCSRTGKSEIKGILKNRLV